jgi:4-diphosphocytidyl-2-C-methyl-D-erythritol kinase
MVETLEAPAPAKVNLVLEVLGRRADGYHELRTVLQTLDLADRVVLRRGGRTGMAVSGPYARGTPADESNLAWRAAATLAEACGESLSGIEIALEKRIPPAGGLGGGASDAATTLRLLQRWWPHATDAALLFAANAAGSDEAFFLHGGTALASGRGESVEPLPALVRHGVVLFIPPIEVERKTARVFAALGASGFDDGSVTGAFVGERRQHMSSGDVYNSFERIAFDVFPALAALWEALEERAGEPVHLAGAGPTLFWIGPEVDCDRLAAAASGLDCAVVVTATAGSLWRP